MHSTRQESAITWYQLTVEDVLARLATRREGLTSSEARQRLAQYGANQLATNERPLTLMILLRQVQSPLIYILIFAGIVSVVLGRPIDSSVIFAVVILDVIVGFVQEYKAEQAMRALARLAAARARVLRDEVEIEVDPVEIVPGDVVILEAGAKVPADLRLVRTVELQADEAVLTGESLPVDKDTTLVRDPNALPGDQHDMAFLGTTIVRGRGAGIAVATGMDTAFGRISEQVREVGEVRTPLQRRLGNFGRVIALAVLGITVIVFVLGLLRGEDVTEIFLTAVATAVAAVPEGLPVTITIALAVGVWRMAQRNAIVRKLPAIETLGSCTTICSDKTGTLTKNQMTVTTIVADDQVFDVTGVGYAPVGEIRLAGHVVSLRDHPGLELILRIGLLCNDSNIYLEDGVYRVDGDPTEAALIVAAAKGGLLEERERDAYPTVDEVPFDSERQYMATIHRYDHGRFIFVKGAPERILAMCDGAYRAGRVVPLDYQSAADEFQGLARNGLRVLAMAYRGARPGLDDIGVDDVEGRLIFVGFQGMLDPPRPEAIQAVANCRQAGLRVAMITGDHPTTALAIAQRMGIIANSSARAIEGRQLSRLTDAELAEEIASIAVYARIAPQQKLRIVQILRQHGDVVAVTGDGVNDAPALKQADVGVAMGITGTDVAKEAADVVLADDNFATIYAAIEEGRVVFDNIRKAVMFLIPTGLGLVLTVITSIAAGLPLPFLPAQAIWINLVTNGTQDVSLAFEPPEAGVGRRPPRDPREGIFTPEMIQRTLLVGAVLLIGTIGTFTWQIESGYDLAHARTVAMTTMVLFQNFYVLSSRSFTRSVFAMNPFSNRFLFFSVIAALGLQVLAVYWPPLQYALRTVPLGADTWGVVIAVALSVLIVVEVDKWLRRRRAL